MPASLIAFAAAGLPDWLPAWIPGLVVLFGAIFVAAYIKSLFDMRRARAANDRIEQRQAERLRKSELQRQEREREEGPPAES